MSAPRVTWCCRGCGHENGLGLLACERCGANRPKRSGEPIRPPVAKASPAPLDLERAALQVLYRAPADAGGDFAEALNDLAAACGVADSFGWRRG